MTPTETLMEEHRLIEQVLDSLETAANCLDDGEPVSPDFFVDAAEFVAGFADRCHHKKEEDILFNAMTAAGVPRDSGPIAVMLREHDAGRRSTQAFRAAAEQMQAGDAGAAADLTRHVYDYVNMLREHIAKEDIVLYPMAEQVLSADDMQAMAKQFEQILAQDEQNGSLARYRSLATRLTEFPAAGDGG